jgi:3-oxocholest-4-en-26-oate---CoA ligase
VVGLAPGEGAESAELIDYVRGKLAAYKAPRRIVFTSKVPRAPNGKADYAGAKAVFAEAFPG